MKGSEGLCQGAIFHRNRTKMDMIAHETVGPYRKGISPAVLLQPLQILKIILIVFEDSLTVVATLCSMMEKPDRNSSGYSRHASLINHL